MIWSRGFGYTDVENRTPARPDTPYRLASLSKPLAAVVLMMLVEEGRLDLASRMSAFAVHPWFERRGESWITPLYSCHTAAGVISTVLDLARFDAALDGNELITEASKKALFTPARTSDGRSLPYGRGWFVEENGGTRIIWHYGWYPPTVSALYITVPDRRMTLILLSNCDGLSAGVSWSLGGVRASPFARLFLQSFLPE